MFYESTKVKVQESQQRLREEEIEKNKLPFITVKILWINFYKQIYDTITSFHQSIMSNYDNSIPIRQADINVKLADINNLLVNEWNYYLPPNVDDIQLPSNNLTRNMLFSERFAVTTYSTIVVPVIGFTNPPRLKRKNYIPYNPEDEETNETILSVNSQSENNDIIGMVFSGIHFWYDYSIDNIKEFIEVTFLNKNYRDLPSFYHQKEIDFINLSISDYDGEVITYDKLNLY